MSLLLQVLASGSKGNAFLICTPHTRILLDAGLTGKELVRRLEKTPVKASQLDAILISHEHQDHARGAGIMSRRLGCPVYLSQGTMEGLSPQVGQLAYTRIFQSGVPFVVGDMHVHAFATSHDAKEPSGFILEHEGSRLGVCTDLGVVTQLVRARLLGCQALVLEANHDVEMLMNGPYPWELKQRIRGRQGHLSNLDAFTLLEEIHHQALGTVILAHLSETNNDPRILRETYQDLNKLEKWADVRFQIGDQHKAGDGVELA
jgi:phosphoribosyl 1,2-cyclic phosphodiesterase